MTSSCHYKLVWIPNYLANVAYFVDNISTVKHPNQKELFKLRLNKGLIGHFFLFNVNENSITGKHK